jgi:hypothetical protein
MSLIGAAIAGGVEGAGAGAGTALKQEAEYQGKSDLQQQYVSAVEAKDMRLAELAQGYHVTNSATDFQNLTAIHTQDNTSAETRTAAEQSGANTRNAATVAADRDVANIHESGATTRAAAEITARQTSDAIAHTNYTPSQDGTVYATRPNKDGTYTTQVLTDLKGAPIRTLKDVPTSVLKEFDGQMLIARAKLTQNPDDKEALQMAKDAIAMLHVYGGGGAATAAPSTAGVVEGDRTKLLANPTLQAMSNLDYHYGAGTAAELIRQSKAAATAAPGASAPVAASAAAPVAASAAAPVAASAAAPDAASAAAPAAASAAASTPSAGNMGADGYGDHMAAAAAHAAQYQADQKAAAVAKAQEIADANAARAGAQLKNPTRTAANSRFGPRVDVFDQTDTGLIRRQIK